MLLYGPEKIGKTTFASQFEDAVILATEIGYKGLNVYATDIETWEDFLEATKEIVAGKHKFQTIIIDTADNLFKFCHDFVCKKYKMDHPSDEQYGKGWNLLKTEFQAPILRLSVSKYGLIFISHAEEREVKTRYSKIDKVQPSLGGQAKKIINPFVDIIGYCNFKTVKISDDEYKEKRIITFEPSEYITAGDRTGFLPPTLPLSYKKFAQCFEEKGGDE